MKMVEKNRPKPPLDVVAADTNPSQQQHHQRHTKTVHFETDVVRDDAGTVAATVQAVTDNGVSVTSLPDQFDRHVQQLFTFIGSALSAGRNRYCSDDDDDSVCDGNSDSDFGDGGYYAGGGGFCGSDFCGGGGGDEDDRKSVSDDETVRRKSSNRHHGQHRRSAAPAFSYGARTISFERDVDRGNPPFRHMHCKTTAGTCNSVFLKKVT